jgi:hypothetical protein
MRRTFLLGILSGLLCASGALALHGHFTDHYQDEKGMACCSRRDCHPTRLRVVTSTDTEVTLEIMGTFLVQIPRRSFYPSEDQKDWVCLRDLDASPSTQNVRCAFVAVGS